MTAKPIDSTVNVRSSGNRFYENGGGAFMIPYLCALIFLAMPICWAEWTMARYGGRKGFRSGPAILGVKVKLEPPSLRSGVSVYCTDHTSVALRVSDWIRTISPCSSSTAPRSSRSTPPRTASSTDAHALASPAFFNSTSFRVRSMIRPSRFDSTPVTKLSSSPSEPASDASNSSRSA